MATESLSQACPSTVYCGNLLLKLGHLVQVSTCDTSQGECMSVMKYMS